MEHNVCEIAERTVRHDEAEDQGGVRGLGRQPEQASAVELLPEHYDLGCRVGILDISVHELRTLVLMNLRPPLFFFVKLTTVP